MDSLHTPSIVVVLPLLSDQSRLHEIAAAVLTIWTSRTRTASVSHVHAPSNGTVGTINQWWMKVLAKLDVD